MVRFVSFVMSCLVVGMLVGVPAAYVSYRNGNVRNFRMVRQDVLYRSGQMSVEGLKSVIHDYGIKTVVTLRDAAYPGDPPPDFAEEKYCADQGIGYCRISPRTWWAPDGSIPAEEGVKLFRAVMDNADNYPVLIHCFAGIHRTGAFCAVYRMEYQHWSNDEAIAELRACGYDNLDDEWDLLDFLQQYQPRWKRNEADGPSGPMDQASGMVLRSAPEAQKKKPGYRIALPEP
jgi:tyrosine-protein phosphatase SIW14